MSISYNKVPGQVGKYRFKETGGTAVIETKKDRQKYWLVWITILLIMITVTIIAAIAAIK